MTLGNRTQQVLPFYKRGTTLCLLLAISLLLLGCSSGGGSGGSVSTPAPGADDEPLAEDSAFNTAIGFSIAREPGPRLPTVNENAGLTDADFEQGLPVAVIQIPDDLDPATNQAPYFDNLQNYDVIAGEVLEIVYRPQDSEGGIPGMFPEKLPQGSSFVDNFDGSKTFRWQPLQMDVGILRFTVTALDPANALYRSSQPVLIRVSLPEDPSSIPNVAPTLEEQLPYTARLGDPVVFELKGIDLNGTLPTIEIPELPADASFEQHPRFEEIYVLKWVPSSSGEQSLNVRVRDAVDTSLSTLESIKVTVLESQAFIRPGQSLRSLAAGRNIRIGMAASQSFYHRPDGAIYADTAAREYDIVTPENSMKMDYMNPQPGRYQFAATDNLVAYAQANDMQLHAHPLIWYRQLPGWIMASAPESRETHMLDYIARVMTRYGDVMSVWDVINEPMAAGGELRDSIWLEAMGAGYIDKALIKAREMSASATLLINEFDIAATGPKFDGLMNLVDDLQSRQIPLDGIGFQLHLFSSFDQFDELRSNFTAVADRGLDIYITELDVSMVGTATDEDQAEIYRQILLACLQQERCRAIQTWGFTDQYSFRSIYNPLPFDRAYQAKPAYRAIQDALAADGAS